MELSSLWNFFYTSKAMAVYFEFIFHFKSINKISLYFHDSMLFHVSLKEESSVHIFNSSILSPDRQAYLCDIETSVVCFGPSKDTVLTSL